MHLSMVTHGRGFTLIEAVPVIFIIAVIASVVIPRFVDLGSATHCALVSGSAEPTSAWAVYNPRIRFARL